jgi:hypothetical protein
MQRHVESSKLITQGRGPRSERGDRGVRAPAHARHGYRGCASVLGNTTLPLTSLLEASAGCCCNPLPVGHSLMFTLFLHRQLVVLAPRDYSRLCGYSRFPFIYKTRAAAGIGSACGLGAIYTQNQSGSWHRKRLRPRHKPDPYNPYIYRT